MHTFYFHENQLTEFEFRKRHSCIRELTMRCCRNMPEDDWCTNICHFLLADEADAIDSNGVFPKFGIDCDVSFICGGGDDPGNSTFEVYCKCCADRRHHCLLEDEQTQESDFQKWRNLEYQHHDYELQNKRTLREFWVGLTDADFEYQCAELFKDLGLKAEVTAPTNDGGIDVRLQKKGKSGAAQCKAWRTPCGVREVREFYGVLCAEKMSFGYFIALSGLTPRAKRLLDSMPIIELWQIDDLLRQACRLSKNMQTPKVAQTEMH